MFGKSEGQDDLVAIIMQTDGLRKERLSLSMRRVIAQTTSTDEAVPG